MYLLNRSKYSVKMAITILYNILFPLVFLAFIPGIVIKLVKRSGPKKSYAERFGIFSKEKAEALKAARGAIWIHAVSVGETNVALSMISKWLKENPSRRFAISTTTTTAQEIAMKKAPAGTPVFFCPLDFAPCVARTLGLLKPSALIIFETEIWPNMIRMARASGAKTALVNARISDKSVKGYVRFRIFFGPLLELFDKICVQTATDAERMKAISPKLQPEICGNIKFDQELPSQFKDFGFDRIFGASPRKILIAASTHTPEEKLIAETWLKLSKLHPELKLVIVPRHAERGAELASMLEALNIKYHRRSKQQGPPSEAVDCLLADTTGELLSFIASSDIVIIGKTLAGNDEGQNIIEPALLGKPIVCGPQLKNFRQAIEALKKADAVASVPTDGDLEATLERLLSDPAAALALGARAKEAVAAHGGASFRTIKTLEKIL